MVRNENNRPAEEEDGGLIIHAEIYGIFFVLRKPFIVKEIWLFDYYS